MSEERKQILNMLAEGKISADDAERLLDALGGVDESDSNTEAERRLKSDKKPRFLHVQIKPGANHPSGKDSVNIKVPIMLLKAGVKLKSLIPEGYRSKMGGHFGKHGIDLDKLDSSSIDAFAMALCETSIDIDADDEKVRIYCA